MAKQVTYTQPYGYATYGTTPAFYVPSQTVATRSLGVSAPVTGKVVTLPGYFPGPGYIVYEETKPNGAVYYRAVPAVGSLFKGRIVVFGASGAQGGAVVEALLATGLFEVVGVTRNENSESAVAKSTKWSANPRWLGFVSADADKPETLAAAMKGASGVFAVTNFWEHMDGAREEAQGKALVDAAAAAGVATIVFSGLDSPERRFGIPRVHHFEHKFNIEEHLFSDAYKQVPNRISVRIAFYHNNFLTFFPPRPSESGDGSFNLAIPMADKPFKSADLRDYGASVAAVFAEPAKYNKRRINVVSDFLTGDQFAEAISKVTGVKVNYYPVPTETFAAFGFPGADDLAQMFAFYQVCPLEAADEPVIPKASLHAFDSWAQENAGALKKAMGLDKSDK